MGRVGWGMGRVGIERGGMIFQTYGACYCGGVVDSLSFFVYRLYNFCCMLYKLCYPYMSYVTSDMFYVLNSIFYVQCSMLQVPFYMSHA